TSATSGASQREMTSAGHENSTPLPKQDAAGVTACCGNMRPAARPACPGCEVSSRSGVDALERLCHFTSLSYTKLRVRSRAISVFLGNTFEVSGLKIFVYGGASRDPHPADFLGFEAPSSDIALEGVSCQSCVLCCLLQ